MRPSHLEIKLKELKLAASDSGVMEFSGYGAVFDNIDAYGDVIQKGAFAKFLSDVKNNVKQWPAMLLQHGGWGVTAQDTTPIGVWSDLQEDDIGLKVTGLLADTPRGNEVYQLMKMQPRPAITGLSIGYYAEKASYPHGANEPNRIIEQIDLVEISPVTFPANDKARVTGVKSAHDYTEREFERILRESGLSKKEAQIVISHGFRQLVAARESGSEELKQIVALLERNTAIFTQ